MQFDDEMLLIHQPVRLRLMALLFQRGDLGAAALRQALELTAGNLDSHARRLAEAALLEIRRALMKDGFESRYRITRKGIDAFERYLRELEAFVAAGGRGSPTS